MATRPDPPPETREEPPLPRDDRVTRPRNTANEETDSLMVILVGGSWEDSDEEDDCFGGSW